MNSRLLEDRQEREQAEIVASVLGISVNDLSKLEWDLTINESDDGVVYSHRVYFREGSDQKILRKIANLIDGEW